MNTYTGAREHPLGKFFDATSKAKYFPGIIAAESTKRCSAVSRNFVYSARMEHEKSAQPCLAPYPKLTSSVRRRTTLVHYIPIEINYS